MKYPTFYRTIQIDGLSGRTWRHRTLRRSADSNRGHLPIALSELRAISRSYQWHPPCLSHIERRGA